MAGKRWTNEDINTLKKLAKNTYIEDIAKQLDRTVYAVRHKCDRLNIKFKLKQPKWTDKELKQFKEDWEDFRFTYKGLCKKYNRSKSGIQLIAQRMNLGARPYDDSYLKISDIMLEMQVSKDRVRGWIKKGLKYHKSKVKCCKYLIDPDDLLAFLKEHPNVYDASKVSEYLFYNEPEWFKEKRKSDFNKPSTNNKYKEYSESEINTIIQLFKRGLSNKEIAEKTQRTEHAIERMLYFVNLSRNRYNQYEIDIIKNNVDYYTIDEIAKMLPLRTKKGIIGKCEKLGIKYHSNPKNNKLKNNKL